MCLSTVYSYIDDVQKQPLLKNVTQISFDGDKVVFMDVLGRTTEIKARIERVNLTEGYIYLRPLEAK